MQVRPAIRITCTSTALSAGCYSLVRWPSRSSAGWPRRRACSASTPARRRSRPVQLLTACRRRRRLCAAGAAPCVRRLVQLSAGNLVTLVGAGFFGDVSTLRTGQVVFVGRRARSWRERLLLAVRQRDAHGGPRRAARHGAACRAVRPRRIHATLPPAVRGPAVLRPLPRHRKIHLPRRAHAGAAGGARPGPDPARARGSGARLVDRRRPAWPLASAPGGARARLQPSPTRCSPQPSMPTELLASAARRAIRRFRARPGAVGLDPARRRGAACGAPRPRAAFLLARSRSEGSSRTRLHRPTFDGAQVVTPALVFSPASRATTASHWCFPNVDLVRAFDAWATTRRSAPLRDSSNGASAVTPPRRSTSGSSNSIRCFAMLRVKYVVAIETA